MARPSSLSAGTLMIVITVAIANLGNNIVAPVVPAIRDQFGASAAQVGLVVSGFAFGRLAMDLPAGYLADRFSATRMFTAGILLASGASALAALSNGMEQLIFFRTMMGFGSSIMSTVALVLLVNIARPEERGTILSYYSSALLTGQALAPAIGGYLATIFDWRAAFVFCALTPFITLPMNFIGASGAVRGAAIHRHHGRKGSETPSIAADVSQIQGPTNRPALVAVYLGTLTNFFNRQGMRQAILPLFGSMVLAMDPGSIGAVLTMGSILTIILSIPAGRTADRIGRKALLLPGMTSLALGNLVLLTTSNQTAFVAVVLLVSCGVLANNMQSGLVADLVPENLVGKGMGMYRFTGDLGMVIGPFVLGTLVDHYGFGHAAVVGAAVVAIGFVAAFLLIPWHTVQPQTLESREASE